MCVRVCFLFIQYFTPYGIISIFVCALVWALMIALLLVVAPPYFLL